jgi:hypothetical protein
LKWPVGEAAAVIVDVVREAALTQFVKACADAAGLLLDHLRKVSPSP